MTALTDTIGWDPVADATGYIVGARDTTAPGSQAGAYFWVGTSPAPSVTLGQLVRGAMPGEPLPTGVPLAAAVQARTTTSDANGFITSQVLSDWSAEITFTLDAPTAPAPAAGISTGASIGPLGAAAGGTVSTPARRALAAPTALAVSA